MRRPLNRNQGAPMADTTVKLKCPGGSSMTSWIKPHLAVVVKTVLVSHFGVGEFAILEPILVGIGMFTGGTEF